MSKNVHKPVIGITAGDINGVGPEILLKTFADNRLLNLFTPVIFADRNMINFYLKHYDIKNFSYNTIRFINQLAFHKINICSNWNDEPQITIGISTEEGGKYAIKSLMAGVAAIKEKKIDALVTLPINKKNVQSAEFNFPGHTEFLAETFESKSFLMLMVSENLRIALVTGHIPLNKVSSEVTSEKIIDKLIIFNKSLESDFNISKPKIAVLGLNPHAGDEGLLGEEDMTILKPALEKANEMGILALGPYPADGFFGSQMHFKFDGILAMYHDQGLIPFKTLAFDKGVNFTAGLPYIRTSPVHGTGYHIAGKNLADENSFREAIYLAINIINNRNYYQELHADPLKSRMVREKEAES